jgi:hypothetical protein
MSNIRTEKASRNKLVPASRCAISNMQATSAAAAQEQIRLLRDRYLRPWDGATPEIPTIDLFVTG